MRWFYARADDVNFRGLATDNELKTLIRRGDLAPDDLVWPADENLGWTRIREYASLVPPRISDKAGARQPEKYQSSAPEAPPPQASLLDRVPEARNAPLMLRAAAATAVFAAIFIVIWLMMLGRREAARIGTAQGPTPPSASAPR